MKYFYEDSQLDEFLSSAESALLGATKIKFERNLSWRRNYIPDSPGVYAFFDKNSLIYIGESSNLRARMSDVCRTYYSVPQN